MAGHTGAPQLTVCSVPPRNIGGETHRTTGRHGTPPPVGDGIEPLTVEPREVAERLRGMLGLPVERPANGEVAASVCRPLPTRVQGLGAGGGIAW